MGQKPSKEQKTLRESYKHLFWCLVTRGQDHRGTLLFSTILIVGRSQNIERGVEKILRGVKLLVFRATCRKGALVDYSIHIQYSEQILGAKTVREELKQLFRGSSYYYSGPQRCTCTQYSIH